ncbi:glycosyltransferase family 9 protein [Fulvivirga sedimenti]|uniref:Glycosyltransferase family 9 protein n=1 Tax=Fulvivirga sedimenti TaxID=2879465 RepID=A0A9X1KYP1_9BACT|nr:glycosyltransferase family 9 protein [Fulvivirga sedimenti]MCA6075392.1 glycosyltransferase family 9 protein [Fulvivirga sedimenti]MCA6076569.1 glycosyltransferase family 9 protein [Fulvivirga sedimenti]MCA6077697.1 glycosyltransferase family 9 protein [Fulvivirga sedimenti]
MSIKKILIIRFSSIGDIVLTTPVIRNLKTQLDDAEVHFCTKKAFHSLLVANPYIDKIHLLDDDLSALIQQLRQEDFDYVVDLHNNLRTRIIKARLKTDGRAFNKLNLEKWLMVNLKINKLPNRHIVDRYMDTVAPLGIKMDNLGLDYFIPDDENVSLSRLPDAFRREYVAFAIGAQHATKRLPLNRLIELCDKINKPIILLGGKEDAETGDQIVKFFGRNEQSQPFEEGLLELNKKTIIYNACGKFSINESASLVKQARYVFSHDTGLMHIAAAFKKEIFSIWGNTIPLFGMYPYRTRFTVFENNRINCRPCSKIGYNKCPKGHFKCMNEVTFDFYLP